MKLSLGAGLPRMAIELFCVLLIAALLVAVGYQQGAASCQAAQLGAERKAEGQVKTEARGAIKRADATGAARESDRVRLDAFFNRLAEEARHDPPDPVDNCVLPADRLRRWADANAGRADQSATVAQPDGAAPALAAAALWPGARLGAEPPAGGARLSPVGQPLLQAAAVPGSQP